VYVLKVGIYAEFRMMPPVLTIDAHVSPPAVSELNAQPPVGHVPLQ
jgi:hypothetical protein